MNKKIALVGPFPPPIHGMAKNLKIVSDILETNNHVLRYNISPGCLSKSVIYHLRKMIRFIKCFSGIFISLCLKKIRVIYLPPDAGFGSYYSLIFVTLASVFKIPLFIHHRSFAYVNKKLLSYKLINKVQSENTTHVFLCQSMMERYESNYGVQLNKIVVSNAQHVAPIHIGEVKKYKESQSIVLGHLSNLGFEKGVHCVLGVCEKLKKSGVDYKLLLAGPFESDEVQAYVETKISELGGNVEYIGYADEEKKKYFYSNIDLFLFPTVYRNEAQPNVIFEANSFGAPALSIDTGCISKDVDCQNGFVFSDQASFCEEAVTVIGKFVEKPESLNELKYSTLSKITNESYRSKENFELMIKMISEAV